MKKNDYNEKELEDKKIYLDTKIMELRNLKEEAEKQKEINNSTAFKIFMGVVLTGVVIWLLIKFALVIGIALAIIIFLVILGCAL